MEGPGKWSAPGPVLALGGPESEYDSPEVFIDVGCFAC